MNEQILEKLFEHNNWANAQIIQTCLALSDEQLDAEPHSAKKGSIRSTLFHLVASQRGYLKLLILPVEERRKPKPDLPFAELQESAKASGEGLLALARDPSGMAAKGQLETTDGFHVEPWVVMVQAINHATEHREQIKSMLSALGVTPPEIAGWEYGEFTGTLVQRGWALPHLYRRRRRRRRRRRPCRLCTRQCNGRQRHPHRQPHFAGQHVHRPRRQ